MIPVRSDEGRVFRTAFVPSPGTELLVADYNQIELRCIAHLAADPGLIEAFTVDAAGAFALAVQWHPEWRASSNEFSSAMFRAFGDACRERAGRRQV